MAMNVVAKRGSRPIPSPFRRWPPATGEAMFQGLLTGQLEGYVPTGGQMVGVYGAESENGIKTFKGLGRKANKRSKAEDIGFQVRKEVQFDLRNHF